MKRYDLENYEDSLSIMDVAPDGDWVDYDDAVEAIASARREGWEQARREADNLLLDLIDVVFESRPVVQSARKAIAAMEYKEKAND